MPAKRSTISVGRAQHRLAVAAPLGLAAVERGAAADRDEHVLQHCAAPVVRVDVSGRDGLHAEVLGEVEERGVAARVAALEGALQLDEEAIATERLRQPHGGVRVAGAEPAARAAGEADETLAQLRHGLEPDGGRQEHAMLLPRRPRPRMRGGEDPAEVRVARLALAEERHVRAAAVPAPAPAKLGTSAPGGSVEPTPLSVTSAPVIGRTPSAFAACANSSEP